MVYHKSGDFWFGIATVSGTTVKLVKAEAGMQGYQGDGREISLPVSANLLLKKGDEVAAIHLHGITAAPVDSAQDVNGTRTNQFTGYLISAFDVESNWLDVWIEVNYTAELNTSINYSFKMVYCTMKPAYDANKK